MNSSVLVSFFIKIVVTPGEQLWFLTQSNAHKSMAQSKSLKLIDQSTALKTMTKLFSIIQFLERKWRQSQNVTNFSFVLLITGAIPPAVLLVSLEQKLNPDVEFLRAKIASFEGCSGTWLFGVMTLVLDYLKISADLPMWGNLFRFWFNLNSHITADVQ